MKLRNCLGFLMCVTFMACPIWSQTTIQSDNISAMNWQIGQYEYSRTGSVTVNLGQEGGNQVWDFTATNIGSDPGTFLYGVESWTGAYFTEANFVMKERDPSDAQWELNSYFTLNGDRLQMVGKELTDASGQSRMGAPVEDYYPLPMTYGTAWNTVETDTFYFGGQQFVVRRTVRNMVDAWGSIKIPAGEFQCLRLCSVTLEEADGNADYNIKYSFLAPNNVLVAQLRGQWADTTHNFSNASSLVRFSGVQTRVVREEKSEQPGSIQLMQNYPNPFNPVTFIGVEVPHYAYAQLAVYDVKGRLVRVLESASLRAGYHQRSWDGCDAQGQPMPSGIYFCRLRCEDQVAVRRMMLIR